MPGCETARRPAGANCRSKEVAGEETSVAFFSLRLLHRHVILSLAKTASNSGVLGRWPREGAARRSGWHRLLQRLDGVVGAVDVAAVEPSSGLAASKCRVQ